MIFKKKFFILTFFLIIVLQILLYTNNKNKTSFRYFIWTVQEVSIGRLISISFFSGLFISTFLNTTISSYKPRINEEKIETNVEIPPQRDIRDSQPTISVNYRVVKNVEENNLKRDQNSTNSPNDKDDWDNDDNDW